MVSLQTLEQSFRETSKRYPEKSLSKLENNYFNFAWIHFHKYPYLDQFANLSMINLYHYPLRVNKYKGILSKTLLEVVFGTTTEFHCLLILSSPILIDLFQLCFLAIRER